jgi:hypothetical protein
MSASPESLVGLKENAMTHAKKGWGLLKERKPKRATEQFREALRLDPELDYARVGMIEALKARYWFYWLTLGFFFWLSQVRNPVLWEIAIGVPLVWALIRLKVGNDPILNIVLVPILCFCVAFVLLRCAADLLAKLLLFLNRFGRDVLSTDQRRASLWICFVVLLAAIFYGCGLFALGFAPNKYRFLVPGLAFQLIFQVIPISAAYACRPGWPRKMMLLWMIGTIGSLAAAIVFFGASLYYSQDQQTANYCLRRAIYLWQGNFIAVLASSLLVDLLPRSRS